MSMKQIEPQVGRTLRDENGDKRLAVVAYHADCIDGFTSAWIAYKALEAVGMEVQLFSMEYNAQSYNLLQDMLNVIIPAPAILYVVDFSLPMDVLEHISTHESLESIVILDHHKTAFERYMHTEYVVYPQSAEYIELHEGMTKIYLDNTQSGAGMCWGYFHPNSTTPEFIALVEDYDLYRFSLRNTKSLNQYLKIQPMNIQTWDAISTEYGTQRGRIRIGKAGARLQARADEEVATLVNTASIVLFQGMSVGFVSVPTYEHISAVGTKVAEITGLPVLISNDEDWGDETSTSEAPVKWSMRAKEPWDVSVMCKLLGGGGHKLAAGFIISKHESMLLIRGFNADAGTREG